MEEGIKVIIKEALLSIIQVNGSHYLNPEPLIRLNTHIGMYNMEVKKNILNGKEGQVTDANACYVYDSFISFLNNSKQCQFGNLSKLYALVKNSILPTMKLLREQDTNNYYIPVIGRRILDIIKHQWLKEESDQLYLQMKRTGIDKEIKTAEDSQPQSQ